MREAIDPSSPRIQTSKIDIYSLKESLPPHYPTCPFQTSTCRTLLLMDLQDGNWTREEKMSASLRNTDEPITWYFVLSSFNHAWLQIVVIV